MKSEPIYIHPGTFSIAGTPVDRHIADLETHIDQLQALLGAELKATLAGMGDAIQADTSALIRFTGAFTGLSTLLNFCSFTRGVMALEKGMETQADKRLVERIRATLVTLVGSQCELLNTSMAGQLDVGDTSLMRWYGRALEAVLAVEHCVSRMA